jgi:FkbM family methyltransferase
MKLAKIENVLTAIRFVLDAVPSNPKESILALLTRNAAILRILNSLARRTIVEIGNVKFIPSDFHCLYSVLAPNFEWWVWKYLKLHENEIFVDVGAGIGRYSLLIAKKVRCLVIAIECNPINYAILLKNIQLNNVENVLATNIAAWDCRTVLKLSMGAALCEGKISEKGNSRTAVVVRADTLDNILKNLGVKKVDWIKIDVEGTAYHVLKGTRNTLITYRPNLIIEIHNEAEYAKTLNFLIGLNYSYHIIKESLIRGARGNFHMFFYPKG